ncbi:MAG: hypothetical protein BWZ03_00728 [bacterium ADurb.BinA186]|nr:MAG: hypothetical protein BWZ03_00728 [bacterium ADurb.BinA186]
MTKWLSLGFILLISACLDRENLGRSSFGTTPDAQAGPASVISMGRDDDDGMALKWHIGGKE